MSLITIVTTALTPLSSAVTAGELGAQSEEADRGCAAFDLQRKHPRVLVPG